MSSLTKKRRLRQAVGLHNSSMHSKIEPKCRNNLLNDTIWQTQFQRFFILLFSFRDILKPLRAPQVTLTYSKGSVPPNLQAHKQRRFQPHSYPLRYSLENRLQ